VIVAVLGCSSPRSGAAVFRDGVLLSGDFMDAPNRSSGVALTILAASLESAGLSFQDIDVWAADVGPGSFTGAKIGVSMVKALGFALGKRCAAISSFDLISALGAAAVPARRGQYLLRIPGAAPELVEESDARLAEGAGYGAAFAEEQLPDPRRAGPLLAALNMIAPADLLPEYVLEPSISQPKTPYRVLPESPA
jgi:tRNA threonylcarbamoyl adenosine modification protein YeaZ